MRRLFLLLALLWPLSLEANTYYVSLGGHGDTPTDMNTCTQAQTITTPKLTLGKPNGPGGVGCLSTAGGPHTLMIRGGDYSGQGSAGGASPGWIWASSGQAFPSGTSWAPGAYTRIWNYPNGCGPNSANLSANTSCGTPGETVRVEGIDIASNSSFIELSGLDVDASGGVGVVGLGSTSDCLDSGVPNPAGGGNIFRFHYPAAHDLRYQNADAKGYIPPAGTEGYGPVATGAHCFPNVANSSTENTGFWIRNAKIHDAGTSQIYQGWYGIYAQSNRVIIENNEFYNNPGSITCYNGVGGTGCSNSIIRGNYIHDDIDSRTGISTSLLAWGENNQIYNNVLDTYAGSSGATAIWISAGYIEPDSTFRCSATVYNNTIYSYSGGVGVRTSASECANVIVQNTIAYLTGAFTSGGGINASNNLIGINPQFVNAGSGDFHLTVSSTAAIGTAVCLGQVPTDKDGATRPQGPGCDMGAYEFIDGGGGGTLPDIPANFSPVSGSSISVSGQTFTWTATGADSFDVYFGSSDNLSAPLFSDNFPSATLGANWTTGFVGWQAPVVLSSRVSPANPTISSLAQATTTLNPEQWASTIIHSALGTATVYASIQVGLRTGAAPNFSGYLIGATNWVGLGCFIDRWDPGQIKTFLAPCATSVTWVDGDKLLATASRGTITGYRCNPSCTQIVQVQDATYATGKVAMALYSDNFTVSLPALDDFWAGNLGTIFAGNQATPTFTPGAGLVPGSPYYLDVIAKNAVGAADGPLQSYTASGGAAATPVGVRLRFISP